MFVGQRHKRCRLVDGENHRVVTRSEKEPGIAYDALLYVRADRFRQYNDSGIIYLAFDFFEEAVVDPFGQMLIVSLRQHDEIKSLESVKQGVDKSAVEIKDSSVLDIFERIMPVKYVGNDDSIVGSYLVRYI